MCYGSIPGDRDVSMKVYFCTHSRMSRMNQVSSLGKDTLGFLMWYQMIWFVLQMMNHTSATDPGRGGLGDVEG